ncbi:hypothetical protein [Maridesulfovibrio sp. FT414]|uniref:hypothetical protein n=1 Tax=Maridesulfovibrio sp. FT414 TaxID=2979469 RepID=UPI003D805540
MTTEKKRLESITDNFMQKLDELEEIERPDPSRVLSMLSLKEEIDYLLVDKEKNEAEIALLKAEIDELYEQLKGKKLKSPTIKDWNKKMPDVIDATFKLYFAWLKIGMGRTHKEIEEFTGIKSPKGFLVDRGTTKETLKQTKNKGFTDEQVIFITGLKTPLRRALRKSIAACKYKPIKIRPKK